MIRCMHILRRLATILPVILFCAAPAVAQDQVAGWARAISGDTIRIKPLDGGRQVTVRLFGVDAPEPGQPCETQYGEPVDCAFLSFDAVNAMLRRVQVTCVDFVRDADDQAAAICYAGDVILNAQVVSDGWGLAYEPESSDFLAQQQLAQRDGKGLWPYKFEKPWVWRAKQAEAGKSG